MEIRIDEGFRTLLIPLTENERAGLEESILSEGCRVPLDIWQNTLIDGHNRYEICQKHGIDYLVNEVNLNTRSDVEMWIVKNQLSRRNLTPFQKAELALKAKPVIEERAREKQVRKPESVYQNSDKQNPVHTTKQVAELAGVSHDTVHRTETVLKKATPEVQQQVRTGEVSLNQAYIRLKKEERQESTKKAEIDSVSKLDESSFVITDIQDVINCDALITDPPYGILDQEWEPKEIEKFTKEWAARWSKCGAEIILVFFAQRYLWDGKRWFDEALDGYSFKQLLVWHYPNNKKPHDIRMFKYTWEPVFFYSRNGSERKIKNKSVVWGENMNNFDCHVAAVPQTNFNDENMKQHPAQKPVSVMKWLIDASTEIGELICDPFSGSGTTGVAALQLNRQFHGIENNPEYFDIAKRRISAYGKLRESLDRAV